MTGTAEIGANWFRIGCVWGIAEAALNVVVLVHFLSAESYDDIEQLGRMISRTFTDIFAVLLIWKILACVLLAIAVCWVGAFVTLRAVLLFIIINTYNTKHVGR